MSSALLPSLSSETTPETAAALAAHVPPPEKRGRGRPTGGALPLPAPEAVRAMSPAALAAHLADVQRRAARVKVKTAALFTVLAKLETQEKGLQEALAFAVHVAKTGDARAALEKRAQAAREAAARMEKEAADLQALIDAPTAE